MEVKHSGIIISSKKFESHKYIIEVFSEIGRWKGFCSIKSAPPMIGSEGFFAWKGRSAESFGNLSFEAINISKVILFWDEPLVISAISSMCASAKKFIPERIDCFLDYNMFFSCITEIDNTNYLEKLLKWELHMMKESSDLEKTIDLFKKNNFSSNLQKLSEYWKSTSEISTKERNDFIAIFKNSY